MLFSFVKFNTVLIYGHTEASENESSRRFSQGHCIEAEARGVLDFRIHI